MALPKLTNEERHRALEKATSARAERAKFKRDIKDRKITLSEALDMAEKSEAISKLRVYSLIQSLPRVGTTTADAIMEEIGIARSRRIRGLGKHQRRQLLAKFS